jgi:hypothetical protein
MIASIFSSSRRVVDGSRTNLFSSQQVEEETYVATRLDSTRIVTVVSVAGAETSMSMRSRVLDAQIKTTFAKKFSDLFLLICPTTT